MIRSAATSIYRKKVLTNWTWGGMRTRLALSSVTRLFILVAFGITLASLVPTLNSAATTQHARRRLKF